MYLSVLPFSQLFYSFLLLLATTGAGYAQPAGAATIPRRRTDLPTASLRTSTPFITTSDGVKLYVKVAGKGLPCVFIHGGPGAGSQDIETLAGPYLEQRFQMIYLDQRGSGRSASSSQQDYTLARVVQDFATVATADAAPSASASEAKKLRKNVQKSLRTVTKELARYNENVASAGQLYWLEVGLRKSTSTYLAKNSK
ncbi:MAG: alpha/beta fold hydrolase [Hymenobacter sp.]|nr:MAG: alpha/beta fold hydrolase [Hymenobacter sp.]